MPTLKKTSTSSTKDELQKNPIVNALPLSLRKEVIYLEFVDVYLLQVDPRTLNENPKNWRIHTQRQRSTYKAFKEKHGWLAFPIYNLKTKRLLDGHMRIEESIKAKEEFVPVILRYDSEEAENEILATLDNIGLLAKRNNAALQSLTEAAKASLSKVKTVADQKLAQLTNDLHEQSLKEDESAVLLPQAKVKVRPPKDLSPPEEEKEEELEDSFEPIEQEPIVSEVVNDDTFFNGLSWLGVPELLSTNLAPAEDAPSRTFIRDGYGKDAYFCLSAGPFEEGEDIGTLGFYCEDYRFEDAYRNGAVFADFLTLIDPVAVLTPDYSTYTDWPAIIRLYSLYRSRWCGRFWQELGFNIIPSLQSLGSTRLNTEFVFETLPDECPILGMQCRKSNPEGLIQFIKEAVSVRKPEIMLLYGGQEKQKYLHGFLPKGIEYRYLPQYVEARRKLRAKQ